MTATTTQDSLQRAIVSLGAICVQSGITETIIGGDGKGPNVTRAIRPALYAMTWGKRWYVTDAEGVELTKLLGGGEMIAHTPIVMPAWWSPKLSVIARTPSLDYHYATAEAARNAWHDDKQKRRNGEPWAQVITADIETGAEIAV